MTEIEQKSSLPQIALNPFLTPHNRQLILKQDSLRDLFDIAVSNINENLPIFISRQQLTIEINEEQDEENLTTSCFTKTIGIAFSCSHFLNLKQFKIYEIKINNIEFMTFLNAPILKEFLVGQSQVVNVKSLNKTNFKMLTDIRLTNSPVSSLNLSRMRFSSSPSYLYLQEQDMPQTTVMQDLSQLVKLQTEWLHHLFIQGENRISQPQLSIFTFQKRFHKIDKQKTIRSIQVYEKDGLLDFDNIKQ